MESIDGNKHQITERIKMPFHPNNFRQPNAVLIGKDSYTNKWD